MNHTVDECCSKHGYPSWYNQKVEQFSIGNDKSYNQIMKNNSLQSFGNKEKDAEKNPFTEKQIQKLLQLLKNHNVNKIQRYNNECLAPERNTVKR